MLNPMPATLMLDSPLQGSCGGLPSDSAEVNMLTYQNKMLDNIIHIVEEWQGLGGLKL